MKTRKLAFVWLALIGLLLSSPAYAQSALLQAGPITPGHAPMYTNSGSSQAVVQDSGPAAGGPVGLGMGEGLYVARGVGTPPYISQGTGPYGTNWCDYDAPITNATGYHYLCLSANAGGGLIAYGSGGVATPLPLNVIVNGVLTPIGGGSSPTTLFADNLTATGVNQGTAFQISGSTNAFTNVGAGTGAVLNLTFNGIQITAGYVAQILNRGAHVLTVYPPLGQSIEGGSVNVPVTIYTNSSASFIYRGPIGGIGSWYAR